METLKGKEDKGRVKEVLRKMGMEIKEGRKGMSWQQEQKKTTPRGGESS